MDVGREPVDLALKPDGGELFVANSLSDTISEVVTNTNDVGGAYMMGDEPVDGLVSRDNALLYVANLHSQYVTVYSVDDGKRVGRWGWETGLRRWHFPPTVICCSRWIRARTTWRWCARLRSRCLPCCRRAESQRDCGQGIQGSVRSPRSERLTGWDRVCGHISPCGATMTKSDRNRKQA